MEYIVLAASSGNKRHYYTYNSLDLAKGMAESLKTKYEYVCIHKLGEKIG